MVAPSDKPKKPRSTVVKKANQTIQKNKSGGKMFGAVGGYKGVPKKQATKLVNGQVKDEIRSMKGDRTFINNQANDAIQDTNSLYNRSVGDINHVFDSAGATIAGLGSQINAGYDQTRQQVAGIDAGVTTGIQQNTSAAQQAIQAELQRLGMGGNMGAMPSLQADGAFAANQAAQLAGNNQANLAASQQGANTVTSMLGGMIAGSRASNLGQAANTRDADIADIGRTKRDDLSTVLQGIQDLKKSRPTAIREMLMTLQAQGFDQWQAIQALNMDRQSLNHSMAMDRAGMTEDGSYYNTLANAYGAQAGQNPYGTPSTNGSPTRPGAGYTNGTPPSRGPKRKPRSPSGTRNDEIKGPLAGGFS